jgi:hypothetical protein
VAQRLAAVGAIVAAIALSGAAAAATPHELTIPMSDSRRRRASLGPAGFASLMCDARGHGASGGLFDLDGPRDVQDTLAIPAASRATACTSPLPVAPAGRVGATLSPWAASGSVVTVRR